MNYLENRYDEACDLVMKYHYSRRIPTNIIHIGSIHEDGGLFGDQGEIMAACFFSIPQAKWKYPLLELIRLVRRDDVDVYLSSLVSKTVKSLKKNGHDLLISFADSQQGHEGYIYQACSWNYHGKRDPQNDGLIINGKFIPGRSCNAAYGTRSAEKLREAHPDWQIEKHFDEGKHLYWKSLGKSGEKKANELGLMKKTYPKGGK